MKSFIRNLFELFVPSLCVQCHQPLLSGEMGLCLNCQVKLPRTRSNNSDNEAEHRVFGRIPYQHGTAFCYYRKGGDYARLITGAKFYGRPWINEYLAKLFAAELTPAGWPFDIDLIIPVPIHFVRKIWRGYNQTDHIVGALSEAWNLPVEHHNLVKKIYTVSQISHNAQERMTAMEGTFRLRHPERISGKHVLLVDDVLTTGATLDACAQLLTKAGAKISFLTLGLSD